MWSSKLVLITLLLSEVQSLCAEEYTRSKIKTTSGNLIGHAAPNRPGVTEFLGIPFAQPPVGQLRFAAPKAYHSHRVFNASSYGKTCVATVAQPNYSILATDGIQLAPTAQEFLDINGELGQSLSEDCLTLNVWTKHDHIGEWKKKAVLLFIYGGGFQAGYSSGIFNTGDIIADDGDVVVITFNYRTSLFGFPGLQPEVSDVAANAGLLDQRLAVEWARDNVAAFGGDPSRITLFGQSAGSASVSMYGYAYARDPIAHALITQSGTADSFGAASANSTAAWLYMASLLGCSNTTDASSAQLKAAVACTRSKSTAEILAAEQQVPLNYQLSSLGIFAPTADGRTAFADYGELTAQHRFAQVPRLLGSNANEGGYFKILYALAGLLLPDVFWDFFNLVAFDCPTRDAAADFALEGSKNVWRYVYNGDYPNTQLAINPSSGAYHGAELRVLFGVADQLGIPDTPAEAATGRLMRKAWAAFAKDPQHALSRAPFSWPSYSGGNSSKIVELGLGNSSTASLRSSDDDSVDALCAAVMPGFDAFGGENRLQFLVFQVLGGIQALKGDNVTDVLNLLLEAAGLSGSG